MCVQFERVLTTELHYTDCVDEYLADDDNDLELAMYVSKAYLPGITSVSMEQAVQHHAVKFHVSKERSIWGTEEILNKILESYC
jgi:hypothetical protein